MIRAREILELTRARLVQMLREPEILFWVFAFPLLLTLVTGLAFRGGGSSSSRVAVVEGAGANELREAFASANELEARTVPTADEGAKLLRSGAVDALVEADSPRARITFDEARPEAAAARLRVENALQRAAGRRDVAEIDSVAVTQRGSRYVDWLVPGLLALNLMSTTIWGVGFALVEARQRRLLQRFLVTPMKRSSLLFSYVLARVVLLAAEALVLVAFACLIFGVPFRGSALAFGALTLLGALSFSGLAILLGSRVRTPEAASGLIYLSMMPMGLSSGVFFSYERFSPLLQPLIKALPLAALSDALRGVMLEGASLAAFVPELAILGAWGVATFVIGLVIFRWQ
jgi:ABC-type multidrug transport system permease subunit